MENCQFYTYLYIDIDNSPLYVGKGKDLCAFRHFKLKTHLGYTLRKRINNGFNILPIITYHIDENTALAMEIFWIAVYGRKDIGKGTLLNLTDGGEGVSGRRYSHSEETKIKISKSLIGRECSRGMLNKSHSNETRLKMSASQKGKSRNKGKPWSEARRNAQINKGVNI